MKSLAFLTRGAAVAITVIALGTASQAFANDDASLKVNLDGRVGPISVTGKTDVSMRGGDNDRDMHDDLNSRNDDDKGKGKRDSNWNMGSSLMGTITAIDGSTITVKSLRDGTVYNINASNSTVWKDSNSSLSKLAVNDTIIVKGILSGTTLTASSIASGSWNDKFPENGNWNNVKPGVMGSVTSISGNTITVKNKLGTIYNVDAASAKFQKDKGTAITVADIKVGDMVFIQGTLTGTTVKATNVFDIQVYAGKIEDKYNPDVSGKVTAINGSIITISAENNTTYAVDVSKAKLRTSKNEDASSKYNWTNIKIGDNLWVKGTVNGTNVSATSIVDTDLVISTVIENHPGFFKRIGNFFRGLFRRK